MRRPPMALPAGSIAKDQISGCKIDGIPDDAGSRVGFERFANEIAGVLDFPVSEQVVEFEGDGSVVRSAGPILREMWDSGFDSGEIGVVGPVWFDASDFSAQIPQARFGIVPTDGIEGAGGIGDSDRGVAKGLTDVASGIVPEKSHGMLRSLMTRNGDDTKLCLMPIEVQHALMKGCRGGV